jgi:hypothetical protein
MDVEVLSVIVLFNAEIAKIAEKKTKKHLLLVLSAFSASSALRSSLLRFAHAAGTSATPHGMIPPENTVPP